MKCIYANRIGSFIYGTFQIADGYTLPMQFTLPAGQKIPDPGDGGVNDAIIAYHDALDIAARTRWDSDDVAANFTNGIPNHVSRQQLFTALAMDKTISGDELVAFLKTKKLPAAIEAALNTLSPSDQADVQIVLYGDQVFFRTQERLLMILTALGKTSSQIDELFATASTVWSD